MFDVQVQGDNKTELDFGAVQRGDAEMEQKLNRVIRACLERGNDNPICSIHDQGAGGNGKLRCSHTNKETTLNWVLYIHKHIHIKILSYIKFRQKQQKIYVIEFQWKI